MKEKTVSLNVYISLQLHTNFTIIQIIKLFYYLRYFCTSNKLLLIFVGNSIVLCFLITSYFGRVLSLRETKTRQHQFESQKSVSVVIYALFDTKCDAFCFKITRDCTSLLSEFIHTFRNTVLNFCSYFSRFKYVGPPTLPPPLPLL